MNVFTHSQISKPTARLVVAACCTLIICLQSSSFAEEPATAVPTIEVVKASPVPQVAAPVVTKERGLAKFFGRTMKTVSMKKKPSPLPLYNKNGELKNDLATRLLDPQRKESPIRTARLFKIPIQPTVTSAAVTQEAVASQ